jgi:23S rRNA pseudouridine1911/1915/1917 synthase
MSVVTVAVPGALDGVRVDKAVALVADLSRSAVNSLIDGGRVRIDGIPVKSRRTVLRSGQELTVERDEVVSPTVPEADPTVTFAVVHEDADLLVVDKPAGLVVHPGAGHRTGTLVHGLLARYPDLAILAAEADIDPERPGIVHRLDRGTSGLLVVARTPDAYRTLVERLGARQVTRRYQALVMGSIEGDSGVVDAPIGRSASSPTRMAVSRRGKEARTRYRVEQRFLQPAPATHLTVTLETGRTHQIRVHLAAIGHPVVGDPTYGRGRVLAGVTIARPFLHAGHLALDHPRTDQPLAWDAPLPEDLEVELARLTG